MVAPQVPSGPVSYRCIALRATWPSAAMMVKGIQSEAMVNMGEKFGGAKAQPPCRARAVAVNRTGIMTGLRQGPNLGP